MSTLPTGTITLLFTDIEGSTLLLGQLGERYSDMLAEYRSLLRSALYTWSGYEVETEGDSFFVAFASAADAVSAAMTMQHALAAHTWPNGVTVRARIGLHTGDPQLASEGYVGLDVHHAARIMGVGHGGQVLLSQTTCELVKHKLPDGISLRDLGEHRLKDLQHPSHLFQLVMAGLPADFPPLKTLDVHLHNLPVQPTPLIGREKEVSILRDILHREEVRLVTLTGPGGTGKTRLGLQVAAELSDRIADGVFFVNLAPIGDPELVIPAAAQALDVKEIGGQPLLELLKAFLREKHLLLLLDNFEQVVLAAMQVADLLAACPKLKIIVTSRMALHLRAEHEFAVPPLTLPDPKHLPDLVMLSQYEAVALFIQRARAVKSDFQVTNANAPAVAEICVRLDGLPLAIELAAARIKVLPPQALLARLGQRLAVLTGGARDAPARQQALRSTIEWSYQLLHAQEQRLFRRLSVFVGGCTLQALETLSISLDPDTTAWQILEGVTSLIDKSLLQQIEQEDGEPRFLMLETLRVYGLEALTVNGEVEITQLAHVTYYLRLAEEAELALIGPQQVIWLDRLEREHDNLRAALQWSLECVEGKEAKQRKGMALRLGGALEQFWEIHGHSSEGRQWLERAIMGSGEALAMERVKALGAAANLALRQGDSDRAEVLGKECQISARDCGDTAGLARSHSLLGEVAWLRGDNTSARSQTEEALAIWRERGNKDRIAWALNTLAMLAIDHGEYASGRDLFEEQLAMHQELGNKRGIATALLQLARVIFFSQGDPAMVLKLQEEALDLFRELGDKEKIADSFNTLGWLALAQGDATKASSLTEKAHTIYKETSQRPKMADTLGILADIAVAQGDYVTARAFCEQSLAEAIALGNPLPTAFCLEGLADIVAAQGELTWAARLWGAAAALREMFSLLLPPVWHASYERTVAAAREHLGERAFAAAWEEGRTMTPEQALAAQGPARNSTQTGQPAIPLAKSSPGYPGGLTTREVGVLRLVAQGLTNEQVAEQLVISPRTVNTHLTSIYGKIGVSSRSAATRYAIEHNFV